MRRNSLAAVGPALVAAAILAISVIVAIPSASAQTSPTIWGGLPNHFSGSSLGGQDFAANRTVHVVVTGGSAPFESGVQTDGGGGFDLDLSIDLAPGMLISASDGMVTKELTLLALSVDEFDPWNERVWGTAPAGATVSVTADSPSTDACHLEAVADNTGVWMADFAGTYDIETGETDIVASVSETEPEGDGDRTTTHRPLYGQPGFRVSLGGNVEGSGFTPNDSVDVEITDEGGNTLFWGSASTDDWGRFNLRPGGVYIVAGMVVSVTDGRVAKVHETIAVAAQIVNMATDTVSGIAPPDQAFSVNVGDMSGAERTIGPMLAPDGTWTVEFSGDYFFDIKVDTFVKVDAFDEDMDGTRGPQIPSFAVDLAVDFVWGGGYTPGDSVYVEIKGPPDGEVLRSGVVIVDEWGKFEFHPDGLDIVAGMQVSATDGGVTKVHETIPLETETIDFANDTVSGVAPAGATVFVYVEGPGGAEGTTLEVVAGGTGSWVADFSGEYDIEADTWVRSQVFDDYRDSTTWQGQRQEPPEPEQPFFEVSTNDPWICGTNWTSSETVTVSIEELGVAPKTWADIPVENGEFWYEGLTSERDLHQGQTITVTGVPDGATKTLEVPDIRVTDIDLDADTVSGTTTAPSWSVDVGADSVYMTVDSNLDGNWTADFNGQLDLERGMSGGSIEQQDEDGDRAGYYWSLPEMGGFWVSVGSTPPDIPDFIDGWGMTGTITIEVRDPSTGDVGTWLTPARPSFFHYVLGGAWDLQPGQEVTVTDAIGDPKTLVIPDVAVTGANATEDTIWGVCDSSFETVDAYLDRDPYPAVMRIPCEDGRWVTDFTGTYDFIVGDRLAVQQTDADSDQAVYFWTVGYGYTFGGFMAPVNGDGVLNVAKAGQTIPVKWRLFDGTTPVSDRASFTSLTSVRVNCGTFDGPTDPIEEITTNPSGLLYQGNGNWQFNWKTSKDYAGQCRIMTLALSDGSTYPADFQFKK